ncbi:MAG: glycosyltransferase [Candidatus Levyibacteriota bacterium]
MKIAIVTSNNIRIGKDTKKGTEIVFKMLVEHLAQRQENSLSITAFCSGDSDLPVPIESVEPFHTSNDPTTPLEKNIIFELALLSKAFSREKDFDLYNIHIGDGDIALPFARFITTPVLITIHHVFDKPYAKRYFALFKDLPHVGFISLSHYQRTLLPDLNYVGTIYNGIEVNTFSFDPTGGKDMMWSARGVPEKGLDTAFNVVRKTGRNTNFFIIKKPGYENWLTQTLEMIPNLGIQDKTDIVFDQIREELVATYQKSKLFLFPTLLEEVCPLSALEAMACGTPVVAFAKGSVPELVADGVTGFIVNSSPDDIRGDWVIKKTGIEGLVEAVNKIYTMPEDEYRIMRRACRDRIEKNFTSEKMAEHYLQIYQQAAENQGANRK